MRHRWLRVAGAALVVSTVVVVAPGVFGGGEPEPSRVAVPIPQVTPPDPTPRSNPDVSSPLQEEFSEPTGTTLLIDNGHDGATAFELDTARQAHVTLPGYRAGDPPFRLWPMGGWVIVGWGEIWAVAPGTDHPARQVGEATVFVPDADPRRVWLVDYPGGNVGQGTPTWTLVEGADGQVIHQTDGEPGLVAIRGVPGGLAVRGPDGRLLRYDPSTGELTDYLDERARHIADVQAGRVVWCGEGCQMLVVERGDRATRIGGRPGAFGPRSVWLSPDGAYLAVLTPVVPGVEPNLMVFDAVSGEKLHNSAPLAEPVRAAWGPDADQLIYLTPEPDPTGGDPGLIVGRWTPQLAEQVLVDAPARWAAPFLTYAACTLDELLTTTTGNELSACPTPRPTPATTEGDQPPPHQGSEFPAQPGPQGSTTR